jgi:hypothetical protein
MKYIFTFLASVYLCIELQSWLFLSQIYTQPLDAETLGDYERFGYASLGLGVSLFYLRQSMRIKNKITMSISFLFIPLVYISAVWGAYELVQRSSDWVVDKPKAMRASISTLANPSLENLTTYYFGNPEIDSDLVDDFMTQYPPSDKLIQSSYIRGLRHVDTFSSVYEKAQSQLDRSAIEGLIKKGALYNSNFNITNSKNQHLNVIAAKGAVIERFSSSFFQPALMLNYEVDKAFADELSKARSYYSRNIDTVELHSPKFRLLHSSVSGLSMKIDFVNWDIPAYDFTTIIGRKEAQAMISESFGMDEYEYKNVDDLEYFQYLVSKTTLTPVIGDGNIDFPLISWDSKSSLSNDSSYLFAVQRLAPFFFKNDKPIINLDGIRDDERRNKYISNMRAGLSDGLRTHWLQYQQHTYLKMSEDESSWGNPVNKALNKDMLRIGAILPVMFLLSTIMLIFNVVASAAENKFRAVLLLVSGTAFIIFDSSATSHFMLSALLAISVKAPQIFVF